MTPTSIKPIAILAFATRVNKNTPESILSLCREARKGKNEITAIIDNTPRGWAAMEFLSDHARKVENEHGDSGIEIEVIECTGMYAPQIPTIVVCASSRGEFGGYSRQVRSLSDAARFMSCGEDFHGTLDNMLRDTCIVFQPNNGTTATELKQLVSAHELNIRQLRSAIASYERTIAAANMCISEIKLALDTPAPASIND